MDYGYETTSMDYGSAIAGVGIASAIMLMISIALSVLILIAMWKLYVKAGKPGWAVLIPFYNLWVLFEIVYGDSVKMFLLLIPVANIYFAIKLYIDLAHVFGKSTGYGVGMAFLTIIFVPMLAFSKTTEYTPITKE